MGYRAPLLMVNRVVVTGGYTLDLPLTPGLNVIWGDNGSGKSTFCNLITYALGGKIKNFPDELRYSQSVFVEFTINEQVVTLERYINDSKASVNLYHDSYPPSSSPDQVKVSDLSDHLLRLLEYPQIEIPVVKSGGRITNVKLTFMRLYNWMYFDQDTEAKHVVRNGNYLDDATRKAVTDFFLGVLDVGIYALEKEIAQKQTEKQRLAGRIKTVEEFLQAGEHDVGINPEQMAELSDKLNALQLNRVRLVASRVSDNDVVTEQRAELSQVEAQLTSVGDVIAATVGKVEDLLLLENQLDEEIRLAEQARVARELIAPIAPVRCPTCGLPIESRQPGHCPSCNRLTPVSEVAYDSHILALRGRLADTRVIRKRFDIRLAEERSREAGLSDRRRVLGRKLEDRLAQYLTPLTAELSSLSEQIGALERQLDEMRSVSSHFQRLNDWRKELGSIDGILSELEHDRDVAQLMVDRRFDAYDRNLASFLKPEIFPGLVHAEMDRKNLEPKLGGKLIEEITSASDKVVARLGYYMAWLMTSLQGSAIYPRFALVDTPQDKGLDKPRVDAIIRALMRISEGSQLRHQIILTTGIVPDEAAGVIRCTLSKKNGKFLLTPMGHGH